MNDKILIKKKGPPRTQEKCYESHIVKKKKNYNWNQAKKIVNDLKQPATHAKHTNDS